VTGATVVPPPAADRPAGPPPPATRIEGPRRVLERGGAWVDDGLARVLPAELNPLAQAGSAANFALVVAVVSGVALLLWYSPSLTTAHASVAAMAPGTAGGWMRALHRYSSDLAMFFVLLHAARAFVAGKFAGARWLPWVSGVALLGLVWAIGWTGYWLVWDQPAQQVAVTSMRLLDGLPIFGEPLGRLYVADRTVPSLLFFVVFFTHMLLPLGIAVGLAVHLLRVSRVRLLPRWEIGTALTLGLAVASWSVPAPLDVPAAMAEKVPGFTVDAWYLAPLALALRLQSGGLWLALGASVGLAAAVPWLLGRRRAAPAYQTVVEPTRCHACTQCVQDCPFDAIAMVPRTDGKKFAAQAWVDPAKCVGCGVCAGSCDSEAMTLVSFDTRREEARLEAEVAAGRRAGAGDAVALVAGDIDGGLAVFALTRWRERLPGHQVLPVPTASWVRPKFVERLLACGVREVLVVRDGRVEAAARDGNRWVAERLAGIRPPVFRPARAGTAGGWKVVDFGATWPGTVTAAGPASPAAAAPPVVRIAARLPAWAALGGLALGLAFFVAWPSGWAMRNPTPAEPELVFSFKVFGTRIEPAAAVAADDPTRPVHMRGRPAGKPHRAPVRVRVTVAGAVEERTFAAKGISHDGPALDEIRRVLAPGEHAVAIEIFPGGEAAPLAWRGHVRAEPRRRHVITFEPEAGFRVE
jgi:ferredoxin